MELILIRKHFKETYTIGTLHLEQMVLCSTLEDKVRDLQDINHDGDFTDEGEGKVYGETAIPCGRYRVIISYSPKFKKPLPLLLDVPGFKYIRIHSLRTAKGTEGCIGVGENKTKGQLTNGPYYETLITQKIQDAINRGEEVWITIKE